MKPRRGVPWGRIPSSVNGVLIIREGIVVRRTDKRNQWGQLWVTSGGKLRSYGSQVYVKPVYTYAQAQKLMKNGAEHG